MGLQPERSVQRKKAVCRVTLKVHADSGKQEDIVMNKLKELLQKDYVILDGGMGTMLQAAGMKMGETPEMLNVPVGSRSCPIGPTSSATSARGCESGSACSKGE